MDKNDKRDLMAAILLAANPDSSVFQDAGQLRSWLINDNEEDKLARDDEIRTWRLNVARPVLNIYTLVDVMLGESVTKAAAE